MKRNFQIVALTLFLAASAVAENWNYSQNGAGLAVAGADWNISEDFAGTKLIFDGVYALRHKPGKPSAKKQCCLVASQSEDYIGLLDAHLQWGIGQTGLEYAIIGVTPWARQWEPDQPSSNKFRGIRDQLEWGTIQVGFDDPLGIDSYAEVNLARGGRTWAFKGAESSPWSFLVGLQLSLGYSWTESKIDPNYSSVNNPFTGFFARIGVKHEKFGQLYTQDRVVQGFTFSSPSAGGATTREARVRFGYFVKLYRCLHLDAFFEKRSFNFSDNTLPGLYTKSKRYGGGIACVFGRK